MGGRGKIMKVTILDNISYQILPATDHMIEVDDGLLDRIGIDKQFDENGNVIDYINKPKRLEDLKNWFNWFDNQFNQSQWQDDFEVSADPYFKDIYGKPKTYLNIEELKAQAKLVRNEIRELRT